MLAARLPWLMLLAALVSAVQERSSTASLSTEDCQYVTSPSFPSPYGNNEDEVWLFEADNSSVTLSAHFFEFDLEYHYDSVYVGFGLDHLDYSTQLATMTGVYGPIDVISPTNTMWIRFTSDSSVTHKGFSAVVSVNVENCQDPMPGNYTDSVCTLPYLVDPLVYLYPRQGSYENGTVLYYSCPNGYYLVGDDYGVCLNGNWSNQEQPSCGANPCDQLYPEDDVLQISPDETTYESGESVSYSCPTGYTLNGNSTASCDLGQWDIGSAPTCAANPCDQLETEDDELLKIPNKTIYESGESVVYSCPTGYTLNGNSTASCDLGNWDIETAPTCAASHSPKDVIYHDAISREECVVITSPSYPHDYSNFEDTVWLFEAQDTDVTLSVRIFQMTLDLYYYGDIVTIGYGLDYTDNSTVIVTFDVNSVPNNNSSYSSYGNSMWIRFISDGYSTGSGFAGAVSADVVSCKAPCTTDAVTDVISTNYVGEATEVILDSENVTYSCRSGYSAAGTELVACHNGLWDPHDQFTCTASLSNDHCHFVTSHSFPSPYRNHEDEVWLFEAGNPNVNLSVRFFAFNVEYGYDYVYVGFGLNHSDYSTQLAVMTGVYEPMDVVSPTNTMWIWFTSDYIITRNGFSAAVSVNVDNCQDRMPGNYPDSLCIQPSVDPIVILNPAQESYENGTVVYYSCPSGYDLSGDDSWVCSNGNWSNQEQPYCWASPCETPAPAGEFVLQSPSEGPHDSGSDIHYSCPHGLTLIGSNTAQCMYGNWSVDVVPSCVVSNEVDSGDVILFCGSTYFQVDIPESMVVPTARATDLYFAGNPYSGQCRGFRNGDYITLNSSLTGCGTLYSDNHNMSYYQNAVEGLNMDNSSNAIVEYMDLEIPVTCEFQRSAQLQAHFSTVNEILVKKERGTFQYDFSIYDSVDYTDRHATYPVVVSLGSELYFRAELLRSPGNLEIHLRSCHATPTQDYDDPIVYPFISNGCGVGDAAVRVLTPQKITEADFEVLSFRFAHDLVQGNPEVWIHCEVVLCDHDDSNSECKQGCEEPRSRRSVGSSYQRVQRMVRGPIILGEDSYQNTFSKSTEDDPSESNAITAVSGLFSVAMFACLVVVGVVLARSMRKLQHHRYEALIDQEDVTVQ